MRLGHWVCAALLVTAAGCKKSDDTADTKSQGKTAPGTGSATGKASGTASGTGTASASGTATASASGTGTASASGTGAAPAGAMTGDEMAKRSNECWGFFNSRDWDKLKACWAPDATSENVDSGQPPDKGIDAILKGEKDFVASFSDAKAEVELTLVSDNHVVSLIEMTGTNDGPLGGNAPATKKKLGLLFANVQDFDTSTKLIKGEWSFIDMAAMMVELGALPGTLDPDAVKPWPTKDVVVAKGTDAEKKNLDSHHAAMDGWNKHDLAALDANRADNVMWYQSTAPQGVDKKTMAAGLQMFWKAFPDVKLTDAGEFAAGDYVVHYGLMAGTNTGDMGAQKATGKAISVKYMHVLHHTPDGKVDEGWIFSNGLAMMTQMGMGPK